MKKAIFTLGLFIVTGAFEQKAAGILSAEKKDSIQLVIEQLDTLATKTIHLKTTSKQIVKKYEN